MPTRWLFQASEGMLAQKLATLASTLFLLQWMEIIPTNSRKPTIASNLLKQMTKLRSTLVFTSTGNIFYEIFNNLFEDNFILATSVKNTKLKYVLGLLLTMMVVCIRVCFKLNHWGSFNHTNAKHADRLYCVYNIYPFHEHFLSKSVSINISTLFTRAPLN